MYAQITSFSEKQSELKAIMAERNRAMLKRRTQPFVNTLARYHLFAWAGMALFGLYAVACMTAWVVR